MTTVVRARSAEAREAEARGQYVNIGRPTKWGNPFPIAAVGGRRTSIGAFRLWWEADAQADLRAAALVELKDKVLGCPGNCSPLPCHGDIIAEWVNTHARPEPAL